MSPTRLKCMHPNQNVFFHFKNTRQENLLTNVVVAIPSFHCYGHKVSCQVYKKRFNLTPLNFLCFQVFKVFCVYRI